MGIYGILEDVVRSVTIDMILPQDVLLSENK